MKKVIVACFLAILMLMIPFATAAQTANVPDIKNVSSTGYTTPKILLTIAQNYQIDGYIEAYIPEEHKSTAYDIKNEIIKPYDSDYYEVDVNENILRRKNGTTWPIAAGVTYKLDDVIGLGLYNEMLPREDIDFKKKFIQSGKQMYNIPIPLYRYTQHAQSLTKNI